MLALFPPSVRVGTFDPSDLEADLCLVRMIFHAVYANVPITKGHVQERKVGRRKGDSLLFCGDCKPLLLIHSCEVDGDCTAGEHYSI